MEADQLSFGDLSIYNERKSMIANQHRQYIQSHPEVKTLLNSFMTAVLMEKPTDVIGFAIEYFTNYKPVTKEIRPLVVAGPSGVGKGTLVNLLLQRFPDTFGYSTSHTTRKPRDGETHGISYFFVDKEKFETDIKNDLFVEYAQVHGNLYGTSKNAVKQVQLQNKICILDIDIQGVEQVKSISETCDSLRCNYLFIAPPSLETLEQRLRSRNSESEESLKTRLHNAQGEIAYGDIAGKFDAKIVNNDLDTAFNDLVLLLQKWYPTAKLALEDA